MSRFEVGQYVKYRLEGVGPIYRVYGYSGRHSRRHPAPKEISNTKANF